MVRAVQLRLNASDRSYFAILKKEVHALAVSGGFSGSRLGEIDIVVAEMVSNLSKHAQHGELLVKIIEEGNIPGIEIISLDAGPGMADVKSMQVDGISTKNTLGHGLGSIKRLSDEFGIFSLKGWGTILLSRIYSEPPPRPLTRKKQVIHSLVVPKPGEIACGDGFYAKHTRDTLSLFLGDGLGHGKDAELAVVKAIEAFRSCSEESPVEMLRFINSSVKRTRGLVATIAVLHPKEKTWRVCGVGNISTRFISANGHRHHNPYNGIVGLNMPNTMKDQEIPSEGGQLLCMCSDGIRSKWDLLKTPGILRHDPAIINAAIFKDFARNTDDMSTAICKLSL